MHEMPTQPILLPYDEHNQKLIANVHPHDWVNPEPKERYHLVVIGAGSGGLVSAAIGAALGAKVALIERQFLGGDCLNVGCVPSKGVISAARAWHEAAHAREIFGAPPLGDVSEGIFAQAMERMRRLRAGISPVDSAARFRDLGIDVFLGHGRFVAADAAEIAGKRLSFRRAVIATGARAAAPPIPGLDTVDYLTNETVFSLTELPPRFGVIGAGPIGAELSQSFARFGSKVTVFEMEGRVLPREDPDAAAIVQKSLERDGVDLRLGVKVVEIKKSGGDKVVVFEQDGERREIAVDQLLVSVGRAPNTDGLGLEAAGVEFDRTGVQVDEKLRTSNSRIYAVGDIASKYKFTHAADAQARIAVPNALFMPFGKTTGMVLPWATYTSPEVAHVGLYADEAEKLGHQVHTITVPLDDVDRATLDGQNEGFLKVHLKKGTDEILGGTLVAAHAGDMIGVLTLAMTQGLGLKSLSSTIFPYPTQGEIFRKAGDAFNRTRKTETVTKILDLWFKIFR